LIENALIMNKSSDPLKKLSKHLFWDIDVKTLDFVIHKKLVIERVLEYGKYSDWKIIYACYGIAEIGKISISIKVMDKKTLSFISFLSKIPKEHFLCYTTKQSIPRFWNF